MTNVSLLDLRPASFLGVLLKVWTHDSFRGRTLQSLGGRGIYGNYADVTSCIEDWVSGLKKDGKDRHWAGGAPVKVDADCVDEYRRTIRKCEPPDDPFTTESWHSARQQSVAASFATWIAFLLSQRELT